jgi:hypothetical protein
MEPIEDTEKVKRMFEQGQSNLVDTQTKYKYSMIAKCPNDGEFSPTIRIEKSGQSLSRVIFRCPTCFTAFEVSQEDIYIR